MRNDFSPSGFRRSRFFLWPLAALAFLLLGGWVVQWLWNAILPEVAALRPLSYGQGLGLLVLCRILFGGWGRGGGRHGRPGPHWREKWRQMSPEERERLRAEWRERCRRRGE